MNEDGRAVWHRVQESLREIRQQSREMQGFEDDWAAEKLALEVPSLERN